MYSFVAGGFWDSVGRRAPWGFSIISKVKSMHFFSENDLPHLCFGTMPLEIIT